MMPYSTLPACQNANNSNYCVELPKMNDWTKEQLPKEYHDLWDLCCIFKAKKKDYEEVIRMQAIANPTALDLSKEVEKSVAPNEFVNKTLDRKGELEQIAYYVLRQEAQAKEKMIVLAIQSNATPETLEAMRQGAGITEARLTELKKLAQTAS